jgi:hypothetical protein
MILPTKGILPRQALLSVGADILRLLSDSKTVSRLWSEYQKQSAQSVTFDWFVLGLDLLFVFGAVEFERGRIRRIDAQGITGGRS